MHGYNHTGIDRCHHHKLNACDGLGQMIMVYNVSRLFIAIYRKQL